jgi:hypothetical protein
MTQLAQISNTSSDIDGQLAKRFLSVIDQVKTGKLPIPKAKFRLRQMTLSYVKEDFNNKKYLLDVLLHLLDRQTNISSL